MPDFVIIGGGVYGCGVAWELAKGGAEVCLLEAKNIASGASGGLGKRGVRANGRDLRELPLMRLAYELWPSLYEAIGGETGYERVGHLLLIERERDYAGAEAQIWMQEQQGIPSRLVQGEELRQMEPFVSDAIRAAIFCPKDGVADHTATTRSLAQAAQKLGADIRENTSLESLEIQNSRVKAVITAAETRIPVNKSLIMLSNGHIPPFFKQTFGLSLPVWSALPQAMLTEPMETLPLRHLIGHAHRTLAMKSTPDKRVMISGGWRGRWNPETQRGEAQADQISGNHAEALAVYPVLADVPLWQAHADRQESICIDKIPIIDQLPQVDNLLFATGWTGHGWAIAPAVNQLLADWALHGERPPLFEPFSLGRFGIQTI